MRLRRAHYMAAAISFPIAANAQAVRGIVFERDSVTPARTAIVALVDSAKHTVARTLTRETGRFYLRAPGLGKYRVQVLRVGFKSVTTSEFVLASDTTIDLMIVFTGAAVNLRTVDVVTGDRCRIPKDMTNAAFRLWEEVGKTLTISAVTREMKVAQMRLEMYSGERIAGDSLPFLDSISIDGGMYSRPFLSISVENLSRLGYIAQQEEDRGTQRVLHTQTFGPDEDVLLSEQFWTGHCFKVVADPKQPSLIGLSFEPVESRTKKSDIVGTLWVDRLASGLRSLEYRYTNAPTMWGKDRAGGHMEFLHAPNDMWLISQWEIFTPQVRKKDRFRISGAVLSELRVESGDTSLTLWRRPEASVYVTVRDSTLGTRLAGDTILYLGNRVTLDKEGSFTATTDVFGHHQIITRPAIFDSLGLGDRPTYALILPGMRNGQVSGMTDAGFLMSRCGVAAWSRNTSMLVGRIIDARSDRPIKGAHVLATWDSSRGRPSADRTRDASDETPVRLTSGIEARASANAGENGEFILCEVPRGVSIEGFAESWGRKSPTVRLLLEPGLYTVRHFVIPP
jgi:hypothetical protein